MKATRSITTTLILILLYACGESSGGIQVVDVDTGTPQPITANLVAFNGATSAVAASPVAASPGIFPAPESAPASDGKWVVTPDQVKVTFTAITFDRPSGGETVTVGNCEVTFNFATASLSQAHTCSLEVPTGTYVKIGYIADATTQVLIDDATNGIYTDPNSATLLSTTEPAGGAQFVPLTNSLADPDGTFGGSFFLASSVEFSEGDNININIIGDLTHAVFVEVNNGTATFDVGLWAVQQAGIRVFVSLNDLGKINYYSGSATGLTYREGKRFFLMTNLLSISASTMSPITNPHSCFWKAAMSAVNPAAEAVCLPKPQRLMRPRLQQTQVAPAPVAIWVWIPTVF